jgi:predicted nucleotidyltransferase
MYQKRYKILSLFTGNPRGRFYLRELSVKTGMATMTAQRLLKSMENEGILKSKEEGKNKYFELNVDNPKTKMEILNTESFKMQEIMETYKPIKSFVRGMPPEPMIVIFGSYASGTATKISDLDVMIVCDKETDLPYHLIPYKIHEIKLTWQQFRQALEKSEPVIKEILKNHVILQKHSDFVEIIWRYYGQA